MSKIPRDTLINQVEQQFIGQSMSPKQIQLLADYLVVLQRWNQVHNLTAINDMPSMIVKHLADSLSIAPYLHGQTIFDVGTGAGLPGIPLAIYCPDKSFTLLDSQVKKIRFLTHVQQTLSLPNVQWVHQRVEDFVPTHQADTLLTRAFASLADTINKAQHCLHAHGHLLCMKGMMPEQELAQLPPGWEYSVTALTVTGLEEQRHLVVIKRKH